MLKWGLMVVDTHHPGQPYHRELICEFTFFDVCEVKLETWFPGNLIWRGEFWNHPRKPCALLHRASSADTGKIHKAIALSCPHEKRCGLTTFISFSSGHVCSNIGIYPSAGFTAWSDSTLVTVSLERKNIFPSIMFIWYHLKFVLAEVTESFGDPMFFKC